MYYNYKSFDSTNLMALVNADFKYICADIGGAGAAADLQYV